MTAAAAPREGAPGRGPFGCHHLSFSVTDLARSSAWYLEVLGLEVVAEVETATFRRLRLRRPGGGVTVTLTRHESTPAADAFDERRVGIDHVAFDLGGLEAVLAVRGRLDDLGIGHSDRLWEHGASVTFRDPDNIQLEVFGTDD